MRRQDNITVLALRSVRGNLKILETRSEGFLKRMDGLEEAFRLLRWELVQNSLQLRESVLTMDALLNELQKNGKG